MTPRLLWIALFLSSVSAHAGVADYCEPVKNLNKNMSTCTDNEAVIGDAAVACLDKFESDVNLATADLEKMLLGAGVSADNVKNQEKMIEGMGKNYSDARLKIDLLILSGKRALQQIDEYMENLEYPEDFETSGQLGFTADQFLASIPCFHDNQELLFDVGDDMEEKLSELSTTREALIQLEKRTKTAQKGVNSGATTAPVAKGQGESAPKAPAPKAKDGESDITGTDKKTPDLEQ